MSSERTRARWTILQASANFLERLSDLVTSRPALQLPDAGGHATNPGQPPNPQPDPNALFVAPPWRLPFRDATHTLLMDALTT